MLNCSGYRWRKCDDKDCSKKQLSRSGNGPYGIAMPPFTCNVCPVT